MSSYQLLIDLAVLGRSLRDLARRVEWRQTAVLRFCNAVSPITGAIAGGLKTLAAFHVADPASDNQSTCFKVSGLNRNPASRSTSSMEHTVIQEQTYQPSYARSARPSNLSHH